METSFDTTAHALTAAELAFWHEHGYLVLRNALGADHCDAVRQVIWEYIGANPADSAQACAVLYL